MLYKLPPSFPKQQLVLPLPPSTSINTHLKTPNQRSFYPYTNKTMELYPTIHANSLYPFFLHPTHLYSTPPNHVHWAQTPASHVYTVDLPGVRKEEIRVEVEDGRYLVISTDLGDDEEVSVEERRRRRSFMRKFRLPEMVDVDQISAEYEDGVLTVNVPRRLASRRPRVEDIVVDLAAEERNSVARAA